MIEPEITQTSAAPGCAKIIKVSASSIKMFLRCGEQYRRAKIDKEPLIPTVYLHKGSAVHFGSEVNFKQKIETHQDLDKNKIRDIAAAAFDTRVQSEGVKFSTKEVGTGEKLALARAKDRAVVLAEIYRDEIAPAHQPVTVEERQEIKIAEGINLIVKMDWINSREVIGDLKNSKTSWSEAKAKDDIQFSIYGLAYRALFKKDPAGVEVENLVDAPKNPKRNVISLKPTRADYEKVVNQINLFLFALRTGVFLPAPKGSWYCTEDHCGFARDCKFYQYYQKGGGSEQSRPFWWNKWQKKKKEAKR